MIKVLKDKEKEAKGKQKSTQHPNVTMPYVTFITHYVKSLGIVNVRYEMLLLVVSYNVASITKMGYKVILLKFEVLVMLIMMKIKLLQHKMLLFMLHKFKILVLHLLLRL